MNCLDYPLDSGEILKKKKSIKRQLMGQSGLLEKRIAILSGSTIGDIENVLELFLLHHGIKPSFYIGRYNQFYEDVLFDNQELVSFKPEVIYIHTSARNLSDGALYDKLYFVWEKINEMFACPVIQNNFELPGYSMFDNCRKTNEINLKIAEYAERRKDFYINDIQYLSSCIGLDEWYNEQDYFLYKYAMSVKAIPLLCQNIAKIIKSLFGMNQKCLVLDLDNTLWGGVAGDAGIHGIELGMETALGEAYVHFQKYVKSLRDRGVLLAVCSKNDESTAREVFLNPNMVLSIDDFAVFRANWDSKADNILKIAGTLNILPESIVFIDDNPAERELIRRALPEVKVPEVSSVVDFIRHIEGAGYFYSVNVSSDDVNRNTYYGADAKRNEAKKSFIDYGEYLRSLQMTSEIRRFDPAHLERITQLINKTNQFNLTTKRYTLSEIEKIAANHDFITLFAKLDDKFGSNGIVSVLIGEAENKLLHIRLWVMSCRVFSRDLELAVFDCLVNICRKRGFNKLIGYYVKTGKNGYVSKLYNGLGFTCITDEIWEFDLTAPYHLKNKYIEIKEDDI